MTYIGDDRLRIARKFSFCCSGDLFECNRLFVHGNLILRRPQLKVTSDVILEGMERNPGGAAYTVEGLVVPEWDKLIAVGKRPRNGSDV